MAKRTEFEKPFWVGGREGILFVSSGLADDYLEMNLPDSVEPDSEMLRHLGDNATVYDLDVQVYPGRPVLVGVTALYIDAPERKASPQARRIETILTQLSGMIPGIDFGDLLPERSAAATPLDAGAVQKAEEQAPPASARQVRLLDPLLLRMRSARVEKARGLAGSGHLKKATTLLEEVLRDSPGDPGAVPLLEAIRLLERREKRLRKEPASLQANLEVGFSYLVLDRNQEAARALDRTSRLGPNVYLAHLLHGIALHRLGQTVHARNAYLRAGRLRPGDTIHADLMASLEKGDPPAMLMEAGPVAVPPTQRVAARERQLAFAG